MKPGAECDVVVVGGGIVGTSLAWFLAEEELSVACLYDESPGGSTANAGSLHVQLQSRLMRLFPERLPDYEKVLPMYPRAVDFWTGLAARLPEDIEIRIGGGLMVAETEGQLEALAAKIEREQRQGVDTRMLDRREVLAMAPFLIPDVLGAAYCAAEGKLNPLLANAAIRRRAEAAGAAFHPRTHVEAVEAGGDGFLVRADRAAFRCRRLAIAAGAGSGQVAAHLGFRLPTLAEPLHMNITEPAEAFTSLLIQHAEMPITLKQLANGQVLIGGGWPAELDPVTGHPTVLESSLRGNLALAHHLVPGLGDLRVIRTWAGVNPIVDLVSVLGEIETAPGAFLAVPGDCGYTLGPYCARLVADLMLGRRPDYPPEDLLPGRLQRQAPPPRPPD